jgi:hypothetical protein
MMDLWDDFWIQKRREWKGKEKGRSEVSCGENSILPKSLSISDSYPILANAHALLLDEPEDGRSGQLVGSLLSCFYVHRAFDTLNLSLLHSAGLR